MPKPRANPNPAVPEPPQLRLPRWLADARSEHSWVDRLVTAAEMYHFRTVDYFAMKVVARGLFLCVAMMLLLLYCLAFITSQLPGVNEIAIPTMALPDQVDLGAAVERAFLSIRGEVIGVLGLTTLVVSAVFTAKALRQGSRYVFDESPKKVRTLDIANLATGLGVAGVGVLLWLLTLGTAIRTSALRQILRVAELSSWSVSGGKFLLIVAQWLLVAVIVTLALRRHSPTGPGRPILVAAAAFATFTTALDFVMIYSYVKALFDPETSGSVVLILSLLAWVNLVVRAYFLASCWVAVGGRATTPQSGEQPAAADAESDDPSPRA